MKFQWIVNKSGKGGRRSAHQSQSLDYSPAAGGASDASLPEDCPCLTSPAADGSGDAVASNGQNGHNNGHQHGGGARVARRNGHGHHVNHHPGCGYAAAGGVGLGRTRARHPSVRIGQHRSIYPMNGHEFNSIPRKVQQSFNNKFLVIK